MSDQKKYIAHLDLDCFFVSVERIKNPSLIGKPVAVGGSPKGRGVISSASYEARAFGVRSAMPTAKALQLCPQLILARGSHDEYGKISKRLFHRMCDFSPMVERASIDEMYMDFTGCEKLYNNNLPTLMRTLQHLVWKEFSLPCSIALASNKVVSKIATGTVKPAGVCYVPRGTEKDFLAPLSINVIPGVGTKTEIELRKFDFSTISDIQRCPFDSFTALLGDHGEYIYNTAFGIGNDTLTLEWKRKSISTEETFSQDIFDKGGLLKFLFSLTEQVCFTTRLYKWEARTVKLKLRYSDFTTITRNITIEPTNDDKVVFNAIKNLFLKAYTRKLSVRLLGVGLSHFSDAEEKSLSLFSDDEKRSDALKAVDAVRIKFGESVIHTGSV